MFTGIIEEVGRVESLAERAGGGSRLRIACATVLADAFEGSSIAVNGVCLTALGIDGQSFSADLAPETLRRTNLGDLAPGSPVNLERPLLAAGGRLSGHVVQGHVDGTGTLESLASLGGENWWLRVRLPQDLERYVVEKGSICLDGISLTVAAIENSVVSVTIIPHTYEHTNLQARRPQDRINVEIDILAKYAEKLLARG